MPEQRYSLKYRSCPAFGTLQAAQNHLARTGAGKKSVVRKETGGTYLYRAAHDGFATGSPLACVEEWVALEDVA